MGVLTHEGRIDAIRFHHEPFNSAEVNVDVVYTVYLANALCDLEAGAVVYEQIDDAVLKHFQIISETQLKQIHDRLQEAFVREKARN